MNVHYTAALRLQLISVIAVFVALLASPSIGRPSLIFDSKSPAGVLNLHRAAGALGDVSSFHFKEAPSFWNGKECIASESRFPGSTEEGQACDLLAVHVAMTLDITYLRGSTAAILSILQHAACPENVIFHFVASEKDAALAQTLNHIFPYLRFKVYHFDENLVQDKISPSIRKALEQPLNYARTYLADLLPSCVKRVIYLDSDVVVIDDISKLWAAQLDGHPLGAPIYCQVNFTRYFTDAFWKDAALSAVFEGRNPCYFNTGVMVMDLEMWRFWGYTKAIEDWMEVQKSGARIYDLGSLPPFLLVFAGDVQPIDHRWNQHGLGGDNLHGACRTLHEGPVSLMHWSGKGKPWVRLDNGNPCPLDSLWAPYDLLENANVLQDL
ncbi:hypothetical protein KP509_20G074700 [Ceratopteris richardii]|uniref:Hexosyltransferase n=1 Tax=Ceratopteris richardii TaxID=49495 RepID=A0A8T2SGB0_CERRI|nr:hypothetical protein KP509_20G074700 [Ceratopteris richardii]